MKLNLLVSLLGWVGLAQAQLVYETLPHEARWDLDASPVQCVMSQPIDGYGTAKLVQEAGRPARFQLDAFRAIHQSGQANLVARPGAWRPGQSGRFIKTIQTSVSRPAINTQGSVVQDTINVLLEGWQVVLTDGPIEVRLHPARFPPAYRDWVDCLGQLLPINFADVERDVLYFDKGQNRLTEEHQGTLMRIAEYVTRDRAVSGIYIDGHTDDEGGFLENEDVSRIRSEQVARLFESEGIDPSKIVIRFHGEYYPVASNATEVGRAANRRVTVRLERNGIPPGQRGTVVAYDRQIDNAPPRLPAGVDD